MTTLFSVAALFGFAAAMRAAVAVGRGLIVLVLFLVGAGALLVGA